MNESFLFFGCWNSINCKNEILPLYRDVILEYININEDKNIDIFIAGDNWYATTFLNYANHKNIKLYLKDILISGYYKLYELGNKIHIAVGNHDEDIGDRDDNIENKKLKKNCMINSQRHYIQKIKESINTIIDKKSFTLKDKKYKHSLNELNTFIKIDKVPTLEDLKKNNVDDKIINLYVEDDNIGVIENHNNYIMIVINTNKFYIKNDEYLNKIKDIVIEKQSKNKTLFVMGHIPLFSYKKKKEDNATIRITEINSDIIQKFYKLLVDNNCIYLCADTHNFSIMKITNDNKNLIQITSGTGGADPDIINENSSECIEYNIIDENNKYDISYVSVNSFGYSSVNINKKENGINDIYISYNNVINIHNNPGNIYTYHINNDSIEILTKNIPKNVRIVREKNIKKIIKVIKEGNYKNNFCKLIKEKDIDIINKMIIKKKINDENESEVYCYKKDK